MNRKPSTFIDYAWAAVVGLPMFGSVACRLWYPNPELANSFLLLAMVAIAVSGGMRLRNQCQ